VIVLLTLLNSVDSWKVLVYIPQQHGSTTLKDYTVILCTILSTLEKLGGSWILNIIQVNNVKSSQARGRLILPQILVPSPFLSANSKAPYMQAMLNIFQRHICGHFLCYYASTTASSIFRFSYLFLSNLLSLTVANFSGSGSIFTTAWEMINSSYY
jgi:hypothetical protein